MISKTALEGLLAELQDARKVMLAVAVLPFHETNELYPPGRYCPMCTESAEYAGEAPQIADEDLDDDEKYKAYLAAIAAREQAAIDAIQHKADCAWVISARRFKRAE